MDPSAAHRLEVVPGGRPEPTDWEAVYRANVSAIYRFIYSRVGNRADAEDITTVVFERAMPRLRDASDDAMVRGYLFAVARSQIAEHWRTRHGLETLDESFPQPVADEPSDQAQAGRVQDLLMQLPDNHRRVLELRFLRGYSLKEAAAAMQTSVANVKVLQLRALRRAAESLR